MSAGSHFQLIFSSFRAIVDAVEKNKVTFAVGHVLRYTPYTQKIKQLVSSGAIGRVINMQHLEPIGSLLLIASYLQDGITLHILM